MGYWLKNGGPFAAMVVLECGEMGLRTLSKAAMTNGMSNFVFVVYFNALGTLILLPYFLFQTYRKKPPPLTFSILFKFFLLGFLGKCLAMMLGFAGINYSSPTLSAALSNLSPVFTYLLAIIFRMEKIDIRRSSSKAKISGTIIAVLGALTLTLYSGPPIIFKTSPLKIVFRTFPSSLPHHDQLFPSKQQQQQNWVLGGLLLSIGYLCGALWNILQTTTVNEYPQKLTIVFFYNLFGTIQCAILSLIVDREPSAWTLHPGGVEITAIVYSAIFGAVIHMIVITWCLEEKGPLFVVMFKPLGMVITVIMGLIFLGEVLHLGSVIGATIIALGFYTVIWGQAKEKEMVAEKVCTLILESSNSNQHTPLLQYCHKAEV